MAKKKLHVWVKQGRHPEFCENCGIDRTPASEKAGCRPTKLY